jgi:hypothetical protein
MDQYPPPEEHTLLVRRLGAWRPLAYLAACIIGAATVWAVLVKVGSM